MDQVNRRGFLKEDFRIFRLRDNHTPQVDYHYHEFDKIVVFLSGAASYIVEGRTYHPQPWDVLFIPHHDIHRPVIDNMAPYERVVIWVDPAFLQRISTSKSDLSRCFTGKPPCAKSLSPLARDAKPPLAHDRRRPFGGKFHGIRCGGAV